MIKLETFSWRTMEARIAQSDAGAFLRWWRSELLGMVPPRLRAMWRPAEARLAVRIRGTECQFWTWRETAWVELEKWTLEEGGGAEIPASARAALKEFGPKLFVVLAQQDQLRRCIEVPAALSENLAEAIGFELDRFTPFRAEQVYFRVRALEFNQARQTLAVDLGLVQRQLADRCMERVHSWGGQVAGLLSNEPGDLGNRLDYMPAALRAEAPKSSALARAVPAFVLIGLLLAVLAFPVFLKREEIIRLQPVAETARQTAERAEARHRELIAMQSEHNFLLARKHAQPLALEVFDEVARILPDDTWVHTLELRTDLKSPKRTRELQVRGETGISGKLISVFEESRLFTQASFKSPVTKGPAGSGDIFHVAAEVKQREIPLPAQPSALSSAGAPSVAPNPVAGASQPALPSAGRGDAGHEVVRVPGPSGARMLGGSGQ